MYRLDYHIKSTVIHWSNINEVEPLSKGSVHVWKTNLNAEESEFKDLWKIISLDEQQRANKFFFESGRVNFVKSRATLRVLLGRYLDVNPSIISFEYNEYGKPYILDASLHFNFSHSHGMGLFAFSMEDLVGVDIEKIKPKIKFENLANRFFSRAESNFIKSLDKKDRADAFFKCWTRKEAFIKAYGEGLKIPLDKFEVSISDMDIVLLKSVDWKDEKAKDWSLVSFDLGSGFVGALALNNKVNEICFYSKE